MNRTLRRCCDAIILCVLVLLAAELLLRAQEWAVLSHDEVQRRNLLRDMNARIYGYWLSPEAPSPFVPPFLVYSNRDAADLSRLRKIFDTTKLPPNQTWRSFDFLQDEKRKDETAYTIHSNSLGFRGRERAKAKPKGTKRIIALGTYETFGHGVNDEDTYSSQLEALLNQRHAGERFEVWNGGRHAASAIIGLARMQYEIFDYDPDLLILDYGFVDMYIWEDNFHPSALRFPDTGPYLALRAALRPLVPLLAHSRLWSRFGNWYLRKQLPRYRDNFRAVMEKMLEMAAQRNIPVILIRPYPTDLYLDPLFRSLQSARVAYLDEGLYFATHPPTPAEYESYDTSKTWLRDLRAPLPPASEHPLYPYRLDPLQQNALGFRVLAKGIAEQVEGLLGLPPLNQSVRRGTRSAPR